MKKNVFAISLGFAACLQAQEIIPQDQPAAETPAVATVEAPATTESPVEAPATEAATPETAAAEVPSTEPTATAEQAASAEAAPAAPEATAENIPAESPTEAIADTTAQMPVQQNPETVEISQDNTSETPVQPASDFTADSTTPADSLQQVQQAMEQPAQDSTQAVETAAPADSAATAAAVVADATPAQAAASVAEAPAAPKHKLDILHGNAYNLVGNEAAAATIGGDLSMPHKMFGHKLAYIEPVDESGVVAFGENKTFFMAFEKNEDFGNIAAGLAIDGFGFSLETNIGKAWKYEDSDYSSTTTKETRGDTYFAGTLSAKIGNLDVGLAGGYLNPENNILLDEGNHVSEEISWDAFGTFTIGNSSNNAFAWSFTLSVDRHVAQSKTMDKSIIVGEDGKSYIATYRATVTKPESGVLVVPEFNFGSAVLQSEKSRVFVGLNTMIPMVAYDRIKDMVSRHNEYSIVLTPNILGEVALGNHVIAFGGANYQWQAFSMNDSRIENVDTKVVEINPGQATANMGIRVYGENAALELTFTREFLQNPFGSFSDHETVAVSLGAFLNF
ncbi:MAG: hypothetical protein MJZ26_12500 [Fibrobacter sp.]|nr:hypothetical protein [Fibrobacter sp.]